MQDVAAADDFGRRRGVALVPASLSVSMRADNTYVNVHSTAIPTGVVRRQIAPTK